RPRSAAGRGQRRTTAAHVDHLQARHQDAGAGMSMRAWLRERVGTESRVEAIPGPSFAYVLGWVLVMLLAAQAVTGAALAAFYAPTTTDAWASVAYVQDRL